VNEEQPPDGAGTAAAAAPESSGRNEDAVLDDALQHEGSRAGAVLFDRFAPLVNRLVWRMLGADSEHDDVVQQVFIKAARAAGAVREVAAVRSWIVAITVNVVRTELRRRALRRWLVLADDHALEPTHVEDHAGREAVRRTYAILAKLPAEERIPFALRFIEEQSLEEMATACGCSLATVKRRMSKAEARFVNLAQRDPVLAGWVREGRWGPT
jgi:RNA polymerase sigma-70 factor (ECF subfamily)